MTSSGTRREHRRHFRESRDVGDAGEALVLAALRAAYGAGAVEDRCRENDHAGGDFRVRRPYDPPDRPWTVEVKTERRHTGNVSLEEWSNADPDAPGGPTDGWFRTCRADAVVFLFLDGPTAYLCHRPTLFRWAYHDEHLYALPRRNPKRQHRQRNKTLFFLAPVATLAAELNAIRPGAWVDFPLLRSGGVASPQ